MHLKQIELNGFKSFNSKSVLDIDSNLIGIIGPNGSGKSNIIDAIRWVLGEQSAKNLRGSSMKDVIFSGSQEKKSKNFAEVSITFIKNNEDIKITRRVYRNGDSDYLVNDKKSKLKDITDIFFDLGINKESYSIITQGKVESILSSKPQDRRIIIEEAAGILKYKNKKKESSQKLEKTEDNLKRLKDIFLEIEERYHILFEQKEKTSSYLNISHTLKEQDIAIKVFDIKHHQNKLDTALKDLTLYNENKQKINIELYETKENLSLYNNALEKNDADYRQLKDREIALVKESERLKSSLDILIEKHHNKSSTINKLSQDINHISVKIKEINHNKTQVVSNVNTLEKELKSIDSVLNSKDYLIDFNKNELDNEIEKLKDDYFLLISKESKLENELELQKKIKDTDDNNIKMIEAHIKKLEDSLQIDQKDFEKINNEIEKLNTLKNDLVHQKNNLNSQLISKKEVRDNLIDNYSKGKEILSNLSNQEKFLTAQLENFEYYHIGVKEILSLKKKISGIHSSLGEIITLDNQYILALDTALSNAQQNIIVDNSDVAKICVEHLKKNNKGRATFLPINSIYKKVLPSALYKELKTMKGFIDTGEKLVSNEPIYDNIVSHYLGLVLIVDNLTNANTISKKINYKYKIVTLDGQIINSGGSITGGATYKNTNSILKNKNDLLTINDNLQKINQKLNVISQEIEQVDYQIIAVNNDLSKNETTYKDIILKIEELTLKKSLYEKNIQDYLLSIDNENNKLKIYTHNKVSSLSINKELSDIKEKIKALNDEIENKNKMKYDLDHTYKEISDHKNQLIISKSKIIENIKLQTERIAHIEKDLAYFNRQLNNYLEEKNLLEQDDMAHSKAEIQNNISQNTNDINHMNIELTHLDSEKNKLNQNINTLRHKDDELLSKLEETNLKIDRINKHITRYEVIIDNALTYLINEYNTTYEASEKLIDHIKDSDISFYKDNVKQLKSKLSQLGNVNLNAIDEFNAVEERYLFYKKEIDDLTDAKNKLKETITIIDTEVKKKFLDTFNKIETNFEKIYKKLFNGGYAKISLENPNDILETGINIEVAPPGKKIQKLSLLSGGEKALTAISLLFAILEIKSSPFVILDEVEAALDDVNIDRFANFLKRYALNNQFLVITHRRGTMEVMDKIFGITMQEKGVSYILPLELNKILKENAINE